MFAIVKKIVKKRNISLQSAVTKLRGIEFATLLFVNVGHISLFKAVFILQLALVDRLFMKVKVNKIHGLNLSRSDVVRIIVGESKRYIKC